jgi:soluble lytic murein transglycosylase-like protein
LRNRKRSGGGSTWIRRTGRALLLLLVAAPLVGAVLAPRARAIHPVGIAFDPTLANIEMRVGALEAEGRELTSLYANELRPLVRVLSKRDDANEAHVTRIAIALVREGRRAAVDPRLLMAVLLVENPWLELGARSSVGAVGLMQVMPFHAGGWGCGGDDLTDLDINICHGAQILAAALRSAQGNLDRALLRYNGCVRGTNTPDCHLYPFWVYRHAGLAWLTNPDADRDWELVSSPEL